MEVGWRPCKSCNEASNTVKRAVQALLSTYRKLSMGLSAPHVVWEERDSSAHALLSKLWRIEKQKPNLGEGTLE